MLIATETTLYFQEGGGNQNSPSVRLEREGIERVEEGVQSEVIALASGEIVLLSKDELQRISTRIEDPIESLAILHEGPLDLLIGTEGPHLYRLSGDAGAVQCIPSFEALDCRKEWYTPWGGPASVRSLACTKDGWVYADIHVGSIMRSSDRGDSWEPVTPDLYKDVHQVATCPESDRRIYANTANAVYLSEDRGQSWLHRADGMRERYGRAIAVHPTDPDCLLATASHGPGGDVQCQLYRSEDAGLTWTHVTEGFPTSTRKNIDTFHVAFSSEGLAWAVVEATLFVSQNRGRSWESFWEAPEQIIMISCRR